MPRKAIDTKRARELRAQRPRPSWQRVADTMSKEKGRWPPFQGDSVRLAVKTAIKKEKALDNDSDPR